MSCANDVLNERKLKKEYDRETAQIIQNREIYQTFMARLPHLTCRWESIKTKKQRQQKQMQEQQEQQQQQLWGQLCVDAVEFYKLWIEAKKRFPNRIVVLVKGDFCKLSESVSEKAASTVDTEADVKMTKSKPKWRNRQKRRREAAKARMETQVSETPQAPQPPQAPTVSHEDDAYVQAPIESMPKRKGGKPMFGKKGQKALARAQARALSQGA